MKTLSLWIAATLALAAAFHIVTIFGLPYAIMDRAMAGIASSAGGVNVPVYPERASAASRGIVRPSPDLLYTACVYDVSAQPVRLTSPVPDTYWSLSVFASNTDNFFVVNDRQVTSERIEIVLAPEGSPAANGDVPVIIAPSTRGIVLFRSLITSEDSRAAIDAMRRQAHCEPL
ncbi:MAG: DUF1254 domain-containing protein [Parvibaculum sp.]|nr:DUF1254 domain-containing protein [Parvibaculum sp.]